MKTLVEGGEYVWIWRHVGGTRSMSMEAHVEGEELGDLLERGEEKGR